MPENSTPLAAFHPAILAILDVEDHETHTAYKINEKIKAVLSLGKVPGYKTSADSSSVAPSLTPESDQKSYSLLVRHTALMFSRSLTRDQTSAIEREIYQLESEGGVFD